MGRFTKAQLVKARDTAREKADAASKLLGDLRIARKAVDLLITPDPQKTPESVRGMNWDMRPTYKSGHFKASTFNRSACAS